MSDVVYALVDATGSPRYVGQTGMKLHQRLARHRAFAKHGSRPLDHWMRSGAVVSIVPLVVNPDDADEVEREWIRRLRDFGHDLLNLSAGGKRGAGVPHTEESKRKLSEARKGKPLSSEHRDKLSKAHTGVALGDEHRAAIGRASARRGQTEATKRKLSEARRGQANPMSRTNRAKRAEGVVES